jgi:predicted DNA binding CopG/RHH family protein
MDIKLDAEEQDILESVERGEWHSIPNLQQEIERYRLHARAYLNAMQQILVDLPASDVESLQAIAERSDTSVSLLVASVIHQFVKHQSSSQS